MSLNYCGGVKKESSNDLQEHTPTWLSQKEELTLLMYSFNGVPEEKVTQAKKAIERAAKYFDPNGFVAPIQAFLWDQDESNLTEVASK